MLKLAIIAHRRRATRVFGPFHSHADAERAERLLAASTEIVPVSELPRRTILHSAPTE